MARLTHQVNDAMRLRWLLLAGCVGPVGCSSSSGAPAFHEAIHEDLPIVVTQGGPTLSLLEITPVFFRNDSLQPELERFLGALGTSPYWAATTGEYANVQLLVRPSVVLPDPAPAVLDDTAIGARLAELAGPSRGPVAGPPSPNESWPAYVLFAPEGTVVTLAGGQSCENFLGYHSEWPGADGGAGPDAGVDVAAPANTDGGESGDGGANALPPSPTYLYEVVPRCFGPHPVLDILTVAASHELVETATDPFPITRPAFLDVDQDHRAWADAFGGAGPDGEVGDLCVAAESDPLIEQPLVNGFMVQRTWSNTAAEANEDPCVPHLSAPYFVAAPDPPVGVATGDGGAGASSRLSLAEGQQATLDVRLSSTAPMPDWSVTAAEVLPSSDAGATSPALAFVWDRQLGNNGDVLHLTISRLAHTSSGKSVFGIYSMPSPASGKTASSTAAVWNAWYGYVERP